MPSSTDEKLYTVLETVAGSLIMGHSVHKQTVLPRPLLKFPEVGAGR